ncbi:MAG TPA: glycosyltransferase [Nocardioidaceae bacterium]|nr:glycosyltransferase [Nocardioidaceae bacterium]
MRVLFTCVPQTGHVTPLLPLAEAFARRGDEVLFASGPDVADVLVGRGFGFHEVGPPYGEWYTALVRRTRGQPGDGLPTDRVEHYFLPRLFGEVGAALVVDDLLRVARAAQPALVVFDTLMLAAPLVAVATGAHAVQHTFGAVTSPEVLALVADAVSPMWREAGLESRRDAGLHSGTTLAICPPSLDPAAASVPGVQPLRPVPLPLASAPEPAVLEGLTSRPLVYVTLGTFSNSNVALLETLVRVLADLPVEVVVTVGRDVDPAVLAPWPAHVRVERFIPQADLLPHCSAVVHHAGAGTTFGVLAHGLASVALPQSADNFTIGERLSAAGAGRTLMPADVSDAAVGAAVQEVLEDATYRDRARALADEIAGMPGPDEVAERLARRCVASSVAGD